MGPTAKNIDEYIEFQPEEIRSTLIHLRQTIKRTVPEADELISYQMPAFRLDKILVWFAAFKKHYTVFFPGNVMKDFSEEIKDFELIKSGAGIRIPVGNPVPYELISRIVIARKSEIISLKDVKTEKK